jgi:hypothetical protein
MGLRIDLGSLTRGLTALPPSALAAAAKEAVDALPAAEREALAQALFVRIPDPDQKTGNRVWLIIVGAFAAVMVGAMVVLAITVFAPPAGGAAMPETILTVFTMTASFLAGLLAPSPLDRRP